MPDDEANPLNHASLVSLEHYAESMHFCSRDILGSRRFSNLNRMTVCHMTARRVLDPRGHLTLWFQFVRRFEMLYISGISPSRIRDGGCSNRQIDDSW